VTDFREKRGNLALRAVIWQLKDGPDPPDDWWEDFHAVLHQGNEEDARFLVCCARCPAALPAIEAVNDIENNWFLALAAPPTDEDLTRLPAEFQKQHAEALQHPDGRAEVLFRVRQHFASLQLHLFPSSQEIADWFAGADVPAVARLAAVSPYFRSLVREQAELWLDANLSDLSTLRAKLKSVGVEAPRPAPWTAPLRGWGSLADSLQGFAEALVRALVGGAVLRLQVAGTRGTPTEGHSASADERPADERAVEVLRRKMVVDLKAADARTLKITLAGDELALRIPMPDASALPRARFLRAGTELLSLPGTIEEEDDPDTEPTALIVVRLDDLRASGVLSAVPSAEPIHLEIIF
jgi:hypothetical protein